MLSLSLSLFLCIKDIADVFPVWQVIETQQHEEENNLKTQRRDSIFWLQNLNQRNQISEIPIH